LRGQKRCMLKPHVHPSSNSDSAQQCLTIPAPPGLVAAGCHRRLDRCCRCGSQGDGLRHNRGSARCGALTPCHTYPICPQQVMGNDDQVAHGTPVWAQQLTGHGM